MMTLAMAARTRFVRIGALVVVVIGALLALAGCQSDSAAGAPPASQPQGSTIDIIALDHPPIRPVVADIDAVLDAYRDRATVRRLDADAEEGKRLAESKGLTGHVPIVVLINGSPEVLIGDRKVRFEGFPQGRSPVKAAEGQWTMEDLRAALKQEIKDA